MKYYDANMLLVLVLPVAIVWRIRVRPSQKLALLLSLGLTVFMVIITIIRVSGIVYEDKVDTVWEVYWLVLGGEVGISMAAAIAFRSFFVTRNQSKSTPPPEKYRFFKSATFRRFRRRDPLDLDSTDDHGLPGIPGAQITGIRTFINRQGKSTVDQSQVSKGTWASSVTNEEEAVPLHS